MLGFALVEAYFHKFVSASASISVYAIRAAHSDTSLIGLTHFAASVVGTFSSLSGTLLNIRMNTTTAVLEACGIC